MLCVTLCFGEIGEDLIPKGKGMEVRANTATDPEAREAAKSARWGTKAADAARAEKAAKDPARREPVYRCDRDTAVWNDESVKA